MRCRPAYIFTQEYEGVFGRGVRVILFKYFLFTYGEKVCEKVCNVV